MKLKKWLTVPVMALGIAVMGAFVPEQQLFQDTGLIVQAHADEEITGQCGDNLTYTLSADRTTLVISGTGDMYNYTSKSPSPWNNYKSSITTLELNDGITSIGNYAFYGCKKLADSVIPNSVETIGSYSFANCGSWAILGNSVKTIKDSAFSSCSTNPANAPTVKINNSYLPCLIIPDSVETIGSRAYGSCKFRALHVGDSVKTIGLGAFMRCSNMEYAYIGKSVEIIRAQAFNYCTSLSETVVLPHTVRIIGNLSEDNPDGEWSVFNSQNNVIFITSVDAEIAPYAFGKATVKSNGQQINEFAGEVQCFPGSDVEKYEYLENYDLYCPTKRVVKNSGPCGDNCTFIMSKGVIYIDGYGKMFDFREGNAPWSGICNDIITVQFINSDRTQRRVSYIGDNTFSGCINLKAYPDSSKWSSQITGVGKNAFYGCEKLNLDGPTISSLRKVGENAFYGCSSLTGDLRITGSITIGENAFNGCTGITSVTTYSGSTANAKYGSNCFDGINTLYCFKGSAADMGEENLGCNEKKYIAENAVLEVSVPIEENDEWVHKAGVSVTNGDTVYDEELTNYAESDNEYKFTADIYINEYVSKSLNYETYYIYNYADGDYDEQIANGSVNDASSDDKSDKETLFKKIISQGTVKFTLKEVK
ncbi:MAG: leucine-rich repeat domain-containing protein [Clostridia bacterium]|nr:leucine-rich repeat domain-containing protein [Clostridia bacterium]